MEILASYAGYTLLDLVRSGKTLPIDAVLEIAKQILNQPDPHGEDIERMRLDSTGTLTFAESALPKSEPEFYYLLGILLFALATGIKFEPSFLLDGLPSNVTLPWFFTHLIDRLTDPIRSERVIGRPATLQLLERVTLSRSPYDGPWPCFRGDQGRTGVIAGPPSPASKMNIFWYRQYPEILASPILLNAGFLLVVSASGKLMVVDGTNGTTAMEIEIGVPSESTAALTKEIACLGADDGCLYCIDAQMGKIQWKHKIGGMIRSSPLTQEGLLFIGTVDAPDQGTLQCIDIQKKKTIWTYRCGEVFSSPALCGKSIIVGSDDGSIHSVDISTGKKIWAFQTEAKVRATPAVSGDIFVGSFDGCFYCLSADGAVRWKKSTGKPYFSSAACGEKTIACGSHDGSVYGFDRKTGDIQWKYSSGSSVVSSPVLIGSNVLGASTNGAIFLLDGATGACMASIDVGKTIKSSPIITDTTVFLGHEGGFSALILT